MNEYNNSFLPPINKSYNSNSHLLSPERNYRRNMLQNSYNKPLARSDINLRTNYPLKNDIYGKFAFSLKKFFITY